MTPSEIDAIRKLLESAAKKVDDIPIRDIKRDRDRKSGALEAIQEIREHLSKIPTSETGEPDSISGLDSPDEGTTIGDFADFFGALGNSMVETQTRLDERSAAYLSNIRSKPYLQPSVFRLPRVSGEMKFAVRNIKSGKLNLLLFSKKSEAEQYQEQRVEFDMQAVPISPDIVGTIDLLFVPLRLIIDGPTRDRLQEMIGEILAGRLGTAPRAGEKELAQIGIVEESLSTLILMDTDKDCYYFISALDASPGSGQDRHIGTWLLTGAQGDEPVLAKVWRYKEPTDSKAQFNDLWAVVTGLQARQLNVLNKDNDG